jgi:hypothetical protein
MTKVHQEFSGDPAKLEKAYEAIERKLEAMQGKVEKLQAKSNKAADETLAKNKQLQESHSKLGDTAAASMLTMAKGAAGYLGIATSIGGVLAGINQSLEKQKRLAQEALTTTLQMAQVDAALVSNLDKIEALGPAVARVREIQKSAGITDAGHLAMGSAFALSKAFGDPIAGLETTEDVARLTPHEFQASAEAIGGLRSATGLNREEARNLLASAGATIPTGKLGEIANFGVANVPGALMLTNSKKHGDQKIARQHLALFGSLMALGLSAEVAGTATASLEGSLHEAFTKDPKLASIDPGDIEGRFKLLQSEQPGEFGNIISRSMAGMPDDLKGKAVSKIAQEAFLQGRANKIFDEQLSKISTESGFEERVRGAMEGTAAIRTQSRQARSLASQMIGTSDDPLLTRGGEVDAAMEKIHNARYARMPVRAGLNEFGMDTAMRINSMISGYGTEGYAASALKYATKLDPYTEMRDYRDPATGRMMTDFRSPIPLERIPEQDRANAALIREQTAILKEILEESKKGGVSAAAAVEAAKKQ